MDTIKPKNLESRFTKPDGFQTSSFGNTTTNHHIHYGYVSPQSPRALVYLLPGLSEFTEIYYETIRDLLSRNLAVIIINWQYQGLSGRFPHNRQKRHSDGFDTDIRDLNELITQHCPEHLKSLPRLVLAHSTGANIALRYMAAHPDIFKCAAFTAPLINIHGFRRLPLNVWCTISTLLTPLHKRYVPGGHDWKTENRKSDGSDKFSSDPVRDALHNAWCVENPKLQSGSPTFGWVHHALHSMKALQAQKTIGKIEPPCLFAIAGQEEIVCAPSAHTFAGKLKNAKILKLPTAKHEILLETDDIRNQFWQSFDKMLEENNIFE